MHSKSPPRAQTPDSPERVGRASKTQFSICPGTPDSLNLVERTRVGYRRTIAVKDGAPEKPLELHVFDVAMAGAGRTQVVLMDRDDEADFRGRPHAWLRKQRRRDRDEWRKIRGIFKATPLWAPEYFDPLPEVPRAGQAGSLRE